VPIEKHDGDVAHLAESFVALVFGIYKVFDLGHCELAHTQEAGPRRDLVPE
jgi:hypothetical protein